MSIQPKLMGLSQMQAIIQPHIEEVSKHIFINSELAILHGNPQVFKLILSQQPPFLINDYRMGILVHGEICVNVNLVEKRLHEGTLVFIGPGTIISPISFSENIEIYGIGLSPDFPMPFPAGQMPFAFNGQVRDFQIEVDEANIHTARRIIDVIWHIVHQESYNRQTVTALVAALMHHYDGIYHQHVDWLKASRSREQTIFDRFLYLVNQYSKQEHRLLFYANKMCLSERYLGTAVRKASGTTAKEWIDRSLIVRIKVELRHSNKSIAQISEDMNFPNPSFFCKYFKRMTGMTTQDFRMEGK